MRRLACVVLMALLAVGCGSEGSSSAGNRDTRMTLAGIDLKRDTEIAEVLAWLSERDIRPTQLMREFHYGAEVHTIGVGVPKRLDDAEIAGRYRSEMRTAFVGEEVPASFPGVTAATLREQRRALDEAKRLSATGPALVTRLEVSGPADVLHSLADDPRVEQVWVKP